MRLKKVNGNGVEFKVTHLVHFENLVDVTFLVWHENSINLSDIKRKDVNEKVESLLRMHGLEGFNVLKTKIEDLQQLIEENELDWNNLQNTVKTYTLDLFREFSNQTTANPFAVKLNI